MSEQESGLPNEDARFAASVKRLREQNGWSQGELARRMAEEGFSGFHQTTISRIEKNERPTRISEAMTLAHVLGSTLGLMIAPDDFAKAYNDLRRAYRQSREAAGLLDRAVVGYLSSRAQVEEAQADFEGMDSSFAANLHLEKRVSLLLESCRRLEAESATGLFEEAVAKRSRLAKYA